MRRGDKVRFRPELMAGATIHSVYTVVEPDPPRKPGWVYCEKEDGSLVFLCLEDVVVTGRENLFENPR